MTMHETKEYRIAELVVGDWNVCIDEMHSKYGHLYDREFFIYKMGVNGRVIVEYFDDPLSAIEFAQNDSGLAVWAYPEMEQLIKLGLTYWEDRKI
jgi:hypothetical protein